MGERLGEWMNQRAVELAASIYEHVYFFVSILLLLILHFASCSALTISCFF